MSIGIRKNLQGGDNTQTPPQLVPMGVPFIDKLLGGGMEPNGVYGLLGPFGSCKTTTGIMFAVETARRLELTEGKAASSFVVMVNYEQSIAELQARALSCATGIPTSDFTNRPKDKALRERGIKSETIAFLRRLVFVSFIDTDPVLRMRLEEGITGIAEHVHCLQAQRQANVGLVVVDYVGFIATLQELSITDTTNLVRSAGDHARKHIAIPNACPVWLIHQLSGAANSDARHGYRVGRKQADGSPMFGDCLDATLLMGKPNPEQWLSVQCLSSSNHFKPRTCFALLRGDICRVEEAGEKFIVRREARMNLEHDDSMAADDDQRSDDELFT